MMSGKEKENGKEGRTNGRRLKTHAGNVCIIRGASPSA